MHISDGLVLLVLPFAPFDPGLEFPVLLCQLSHQFFIFLLDCLHFCLFSDEFLVKRLLQLLFPSHSLQLVG